MATLNWISFAVVIGIVTLPAMAQYGGGSGGSAAATGGAGGVGVNAYDFHSTYHMGFERPEAWGLKYFASASLLSGLQPPRRRRATISARSRWGLNRVAADTRCRAATDRVLWKIA